jgi:hypothetical protein
VSGKVDPQWHDVHPLARQPEILGHEVAVVAAVDKETVKKLRML